MIINNVEINSSSPVYFIADIAANHDGDLERAKDLIYLAAESGAHAAKFQHFQAETIVSDLGFKSLGTQKSHQALWGKSVFEVYKDASLSLDWSFTLKETCDKAGIAFFTSPYSFELVDHIDSYVPAYKIGSGDITWIDLICYIAGKNKPYILATGAADIKDVHRAVTAATSINKDFCLMQCNTNYTGSKENFKYINLNVLNLYKTLYPNLILGLSDHTPGHSTVLGAIALGAKMIEKHFTDNCNRKGPDHPFSMDPNSWREMCDRSIELEYALGSAVKKVEENELETVVLQRRAIYLNTDLAKGETIKNEDLVELRPCPKNAIPPYLRKEITGKKLKKSVNKGEILRWSDLD